MTKEEKDVLMELIYAFDTEEVDEQAIIDYVEKLIEAAYEKGWDEATYKFDVFP